MTANPIEFQLSPFAIIGENTLNVGYRDASKGHVVTSVEVPSEMIERAIITDLSVEIVLSADGSIASAAHSKASVYASASSIPIDQLVEAYLISENLHMEEVSERDLRGLLVRLEKSVGAVRRTIENHKLATD
jgi:hypothetical protein